MSDDTQRRNVLALELLVQLKDVTGHIRRITHDLGDSSESFLRKVYDDHTDKITEKVDLFNQNVQRVKELNHRVTDMVNEWYQFIKSEKEMSSLLFPLKFHVRRSKVRNSIRELKQEITAVGIKNRLIREDIQRLQGTLEFEASQRLKKDVRYGDYLSHLKTKSQLLDEIRYLLPTLPGIPVRKIDMDHLDEAIEALSV